jgi:hypothetical protein
MASLQFPLPDAGVPAGEGQRPQLWLFAACFRRVRQHAHRARERHILHEPKAADQLEQAIEAPERFADGAVSDPRFHAQVQAQELRQDSDVLQSPARRDGDG